MYKKRHCQENCEIFTSLDILRYKYIYVGEFICGFVQRGCTIHSPVGLVKKNRATLQ